MIVYHRIGFSYLGIASVDISNANLFIRANNISNL